MEAVRRAIQPLAAAEVVGFDTPARALFVYFGSFLWVAAIVSVNALAIGMDDVSHRAVIHGSLIAGNVAVFLVQTADVLTFNQTFWPLLSLNWCLQLADIGLAAAVVARALTLPSTMRVLAGIGLLLAQCLFTASQFSVTLSYLWRHSLQTSSRATRFRVATRA